MSERPTELAINIRWYSDLLTEKHTALRGILCALSTAVGYYIYRAVLVTFPRHGIKSNSRP